MFPGSAAWVISKRYERAVELLDRCFIVVGFGVADESSLKRARRKSDAALAEDIFVWERFSTLCQAR
jgi:hypothetical protein